MIEQLNRTSIGLTVEVDQPDIDTRFENLIYLTYLNDKIEDTSLQADEKALFVGDRDALLDDLLTNPTDLFMDDFKWLQGMYRSRTMTETDSYGTITSQFVTRDPSRVRADLHFRELLYPSGTTEQVVEVPQRGSDAMPFFISVSNGELRIAASVYERGQYRRTEIDPQSDAGIRLLKEFFTHSDNAKDLVEIIRTEDGNRMADEQAKKFLARKIIDQRTIN